MSNRDLRAAFNVIKNAWFVHYQSKEEPSVILPKIVMDSYEPNPVAGPFKNKEEAEAYIKGDFVEPKENNVTPIKPNIDAAQSLRNIADQIERGELPNEATVVCGTEVFHAGQVSDAKAASDAVFNLTVGIHRLMRPVMEGLDD